MFALEEEKIKEKEYKDTGIFMYTDHYNTVGDRISVHTIDKSDDVKIEIANSLPEGYRRYRYSLNKDELAVMIKIIQLVWQNKNTFNNFTFQSGNKVITIKTEKSLVELEKNKHMTIKVNDRPIVYGLDIKDSRRFYKLLVDLVTKKKSNEIV